MFQKWTSGSVPPSNISSATTIQTEVKGVYRIELDIYRCKYTLIIIIQHVFTYILSRRELVRIKQSVFRFLYNYKRCIFLGAGKINTDYS